MTTVQSTPTVSETEPRSLRVAWLALTGLSAVFLVEMLDNSILNLALPTIGRDLRASTTALQWVTGAYAVVFGGLMLVFGAVADRFGRRRIMLLGLILLIVASAATLAVTTPAQLIAVRIAMGIAAAMTTPGSMSLTFRLFADDKLRVRAITFISTVGLVGLALGPVIGGLVLAVAPWQVLLLVNAPIALLGYLGIRRGIDVDDPASLHYEPLDLPGAVLGTVAIFAAILAPTLFVDHAPTWAAWTVTAVAAAAAALFVLREHLATYPLLDLALVRHPLVSSGLAFKAATGLATAGLGYLVTLQMQLEWGWPPALAAVAMLPQVIVLIAGGVVITPLIARVGLGNAAWLSATVVVGGLAVYAALGTHGYVWVVVTLVLVAAGMRVVGVVAGTNVMRGLPESRTTIGAALTDTATEVMSALGIAITGTILAAIFTGALTSGSWSEGQIASFHHAATTVGMVLTVIAAVFVGCGIFQSRRAEVVENARRAPSYR